MESATQLTPGWYQRPSVRISRTWLDECFRGVGMKQTWLWAILPLVALITSIGIFLSIDPLGTLGVSAPPLENLTVERTVLGDRSYLFFDNFDYWSQSG